MTQESQFEKSVDWAHERLRVKGYHRDGDFFVNVNRAGAEAIHVSTIAMIIDAALPVARTPLSDAVSTVLEGFTLPHEAREILEAAYYSGITQEQG